MMRISSWLGIALLCAVAAPVSAHLYTQDDLVVSLADGAHSLLTNSNSAWVVQYFAHWCGHCQHFKDTWVQLARDIYPWRPAIYAAVLDCGDQVNAAACNLFGIEGFPTIKFFPAQAKQPSDGIKTWRRNVDDLKKFIIDTLEAQKDSPPPACPPLEPISTPEVEQFFENNDEVYLVLIFENSESYMAREVELDMVQYDGASVRRVLSTQNDLVTKFNVSSFPSGVILSRNGSVSRIQLAKESRADYTNFLHSLPGVKKLSLNLIGWSGKEEKVLPRRPASSSKVYMADLESSLSYSLRSEVARYPTLEGEHYEALYKYITVLKLHFPARPYLRNLLNNMYDFLSENQGQSVSYQSFADVLNNKDQKTDAVLSSKENYVWCQGSQTMYRGYPCTVWTLYHLLTCQAAEMRTDYSDPQQVLKAMRGYIFYFFGCRSCAEEFEKMASQSMSSVKTHDEAIMWLWRSHNRVNQRLASGGQQDPEFPKIQWPSKDLCPTCRRKLSNKENIETWNQAAVLRFLKGRFSKKKISNDYLEDEGELLKKQREDAKSSIEQPKGESEAVEKEQNPPAIATVPPNKSGDEEKDDLLENIKEKLSSLNRPTIIEMKPNVASHGDKEETILDLDAYNNYFRGRTLQDSNSRLHKRALHPKILLDPSDFDEKAVKERLIKSGVDSKFFIGVVVEDGSINWKGRWVKMLEFGFSRLDISLCIILYFLTSMCLLIMYFYLSIRPRYLRQWCRGYQA